MVGESEIYICDENGMNELGNLISLRHVSVKGMNDLGLTNERKVWRNTMKRKVEERGRMKWRDSLNGNDSSKEYKEWKKIPGNVSYADGSVGAKVRMMLRGGYLPVRGSENMRWKYENDKCTCGETETPLHVLCECGLYERARRESRMNLDMNVMKGYVETSKREEENVLASMGVIWSMREDLERVRDSI